MPAGYVAPTSAATQRKIEGPKACGKTTTALRIAASSVMGDTDPSVREALAVDPGLVLEGDRPRLLDEWQVAPDLWNHVRRAVDAAGGPGQFILTGSAVPADDVNRHSGAGRFSFLRMRPMSLFESGHASGDVSLEALLDGGAPRAVDSGLTVRELAGYLDALSRLMVIEDQPAWAPHLRSKAVLRTSAKRHFACPSLAVATLRAGPDPLLADLNLFGLLFESLVVRDLRVWGMLR